ncbi:hypothetical protein DKX38_013431 [Salix brachista]|uniref:Transmembrane protein n=1 Tax=Salix brachista TaxID=2182728 RepID=A0A5N5LRK3_9ROSI|nr:hypothetical protein DKX38_013431 [Salix brachista]
MRAIQPGVNNGNDGSPAERGFKMTAALGIGKGNLLKIREADPKNAEPSNEVLNPGPSKRSSDLSLQISPRPVGFGTSCSGKDLLHSYNSYKSNSPGILLRAFSLKRKSAAPDGEKSSLLNSDHQPALDSPIMATFKSAFTWERCTSLPVTPASNLSPSPSKGAGHVIPRSLSVPGRNVVIVRSASFTTHNEHVATDHSNGHSSRVSVTPDRYGFPTSRSGKSISALTAAFAWQDFVVLVLISTVCYFFFLEQVLIRDMKTQAIIVAAPFAFTLGLLSSIFAVILAMREYIWTYAALEFAFVAITVHLFYSMNLWSECLSHALFAGISLLVPTH